MNDNRRIDALLNNLKERYGTQGIYDFAHKFEKLSYSDLADLVYSEARDWRKLGVQCGSCVLLSVPTGIELLVHILALMYIGATPSPVSNMMSTTALSYIIKNIRPFAIYTVGLRPPVEDDFQSQEHGLKDDGILFINTENRYNPLYENKLMLTSSGSTGFPKSILHHSDKSIRNAQLHMKAIEEETGGTYLSSLQAFFSYGLVAGIFGSLLYGKSIIMPERPFYPKLWFEYCTRFGISLSSMTPGLLKKLLKIDAEFPETLKKITIGGEHADLLDVEILRERFSGGIYLTYGLSEAGPRVCTNKISETNREEWVFMGQPLEGVTMELKNRNPGCGELIINSPTLMQGYIIDGKLCSDDQFIDDDWLLTGDICEKTEENNFRYMDRAKKIIKCNGEMIYPGLIRSVLLEHPDIEDVVIESEESELLGYEPVARIKLKENTPSIPNLKKYCAKKLRLLEIPRKFIVSSEVENFKK